MPKVTPTSQLHTLGFCLWCRCQREWNYRTKNKFNWHAVQNHHSQPLRGKTYPPPSDKHPGQREQKMLWPWRHKHISFLTHRFKSCSRSPPSDWFIFRFFFLKQMKSQQTAHHLVTTNKHESNSKKSDKFNLHLHMPECIKTSIILN